MKRVLTWTMLSFLLCLLCLVGIVRSADRTAPASKPIKTITRSHAPINQSSIDLVKNDRR